MLQPGEDYRKWLKGVYTARKAEDSSYTLLDFAKDIGIGKTSLYEILAFKRHLAKKNAETIASHLGLGDDEKANLLNAIPSQKYGTTSFDSGEKGCLKAVTSLREMISTHQASTAVSQQVMAELVSIESRLYEDLSAIGNDEHLNSRVSSLVDQADIYTHTGQIQRAREQARAAMNIAKDLSSVEAPHDINELVIADAHWGLAFSSVLNGDLDTQLEGFNEATRIYQSHWQRAEPPSHDLLLKYCRIHFDTGFAYVRMGLIDEAERYFIKVERQANNLPEDISTEIRLRCQISACRALTVCAYERGEFEDSIKGAKQLASLARQGVELDSSHRVFSLALGLSAQFQARAYHLLGRYDEALSHAEQAVANQQALLLKEPSNAHFLRQLAEAERVLGDVQNARAPGGGTESYASALAKLEQITRGQQHNIHDAFHSAVCMALWAHAQLQRGDSDQAMVMEAEALDRLKSYIELCPKIFNWTIMVLETYRNQLDRLAASDSEQLNVVSLQADHHWMLESWLEAMQKPAPTYHWHWSYYFLEFLQTAQGLNFDFGSSKAAIRAILAKITQHKPGPLLELRISVLGEWLS